MHMEIRSVKSSEESLKLLEALQKSIDEKKSQETKRRLELEFMAQDGLRQTGLPRRGKFCDRIVSEHLHLEINSRQHMVDVLYKEAVRRGQFKQFINALRSLPTLSDLLGVKGCGLFYIVTEIEKYYEIESKQLKRIKARLSMINLILLVDVYFKGIKF